MKYIYLTGLLWLLFTSCSDFLKEYSLDQAYVRGYSDLDELLIGETYMATEYYDMNLDKVYYPYIHMMANQLFLIPKTIFRIHYLAIPDRVKPG